MKRHYRGSGPQYGGKRPYAPGGRMGMFSRINYNIRCPVLKCYWAGVEWGKLATNSL